MGRVPRCPGYRHLVRASRAPGPLLQKYGKENSYLFYRYEVEIILQVDFVSGCEIAGDRSAYHNNLADRPVQEHGSKNNYQEDDVVQALNPGVLTLFSISCSSGRGIFL